MNFLQTGIPASGNRWVRAALRARNKLSWNTPYEYIVQEIKRRCKGGVWCHVPYFPEFSSMNMPLIYIRRREIRDQLVSYTRHPGKMKPPDYITDYQPYTDLENAMRTCAQVYKLMQPWEEHATHIIYYEDLCKDWRQALGPLFEILKINPDAAHERVQHDCKNVVRKGCPGIGQYKEVWNAHYQALYEELFEA